MEFPLTAVELIILPLTLKINHWNLIQWFNYNLLKRLLFLYQIQKLLFVKNFDGSDILSLF